jgi:membrane-associated protease RseP (regulator of RpoE activity)
MNRTAVYGVLLAVLGVAAGVVLGRRGERAGVEPVGESLPVSVSRYPSGSGVSASPDAGDRHAARLQRQLDLLAAKLAAEGDQRRRLEQQVQTLATELAALGGSGHETSGTAAAKAAPVAPALATTPGSAADSASPHEGTTPMERALVAAGVDATTATEIRRRRDELSLSEIYLRDQATREGWLDTPRFTAEMAEIERQRTSVRDEIGDEAYDRYLAALDQPNRVTVDEVMLESPAAVAGLQTGDMVLRYGETRIFSPSDLVSATRGGTAGENVRVEVIRQGRRFEIEVPRGPLGVMIGAARGDPGEG